MTTGVLHELGGAAGLPRLLISHATGFHAHCYLPIVSALADRFHSFGLDYRGHGHNPSPAGWRVDWRWFGEEALGAAELVAPDGGLVAFGHSMGGAALLMAAHRDPGRFERLVLFEPVVMPPPEQPIDPESVPLVAGARRRRRRFADLAEAYENYAGKPPMSLMTPAALRAYVQWGFRPTASGEVELRCAPEFESATFAASWSNGVWELLPEIEVPTVVVSGAVDEAQPSNASAAIAERLPRGRLVVIEHQTHFGPFSHPDEVAALIAG